jgi:hypothetical protein
MESGKAFIKDLHKEFYTLLKQKSTSFTTLREMKTRDFTIPELSLMSREAVKWHSENNPGYNRNIRICEEIETRPEDNPFTQKAGFILLISKDKKISMKYMTRIL